VLRCVEKRRVTAGEARGEPAQSAPPTAGVA
jgi:hypothetical protein